MNRCNSAVRLQLHGVLAFLNIGHDALFHENPVPHHERKDCPQAARMVRYAVAVLLQHLQKSLFVKIVLGL